MDRQRFFLAEKLRTQPVNEIIPVVSKSWTRCWRYHDDFAGPNQ